jgi:membrane protein
VASFLLTFFKSHYRELSAPLEWGIDILRWAIALGMMFLTVATIYYFGPRIGKSGGHFRFITPGGIFTVAVWILLGIAFRFYIDHFGKSYGQTYGAVGGVVILLLFLYLTSLVLLVGAEINSEFDFAMYGRTGGTAPKPGEKPDLPKEANPTAPHGPGATGTAASNDDRGLPPPPPPPPRTPNGKWILAGITAAAGLAAGYLLKPPDNIYQPPLTPKRKLKKDYPLTYAALRLKT